jgi:hypothetical protein
MANKKTMFHSELSKLGEVEALIKTPVMASKFQGKPPYVILEVEGEERIYNTENEGCEAAFDGLEGHRVVMEARGSRDDATIEILEDLGAESRPAERQPPRGRQPARQPARSERRPAREERPPARETRRAPVERPARDRDGHHEEPAPYEPPPAPPQEDPQAAMRLFEAKLCRRVNGMNRCLDAAVAVAQRFEMKHKDREKMSTTAIKEMAVHFSIGIGDRMTDTLPVKVDDMPPKPKTETKPSEKPADTAGQPQQAAQ